MNSYHARRTTRILMAVLGVMLFAVSSAPAQQIRVLLIMPTQPGKLARQVTRFDDSLTKASGQIVRANTLADADAIVQFTTYRHAVDQQRVSHDSWYGWFTLLKRPVREAERAPDSPEPFQFMVFGHEDWQVEPAVELLGRVLARALGLDTQPDRNDGDLKREPPNNEMQRTKPAQAMELRR